MFFLLAALAKGIEIAFGSNICPCQKYQLFCTPGCPCDTNCPNSNQAAANPRYLYRKDMLPKCPESRFAQVSGSLGQWLLREFFCISTDNRPIPNPQKYSDTVNPEALNATIETPAEALYGGKIIISSTDPTLNQTEFSLPEQGITSTCANSPVKFMLPIESQTCRAPPHTWPGINGPVIDYMIAGNYNFTINPIRIDTTLPLTNSYVYTFVLFTQTPESSILRITNGPTIAGEAYVSVSFLTFPNNETFQNTYLNVTNIQNSGLLPVRSGKWGYSLGAPVIAFYDDPDNPGDVIFDDIYQPYMRIPFGTDCSTLKNTYLKFGIDTVSGCKNPASPAPLNTLSYIPKGIAAIGNPTLDLNDTTIWINPNSQNLCGTSSLGQSINMIINYQRMGTVDDFQYRIVTITTSCFDMIDSSDFVFSVSFQLEQTDVQMFVPRKPDALPALKPGVFYPFSAGTISRPSAFLLTFMAFVSTMTFVFL